MSVINGTIRAVSVLSDSLAYTKAGARKTAVVVADFGVYASADTATITGVNTAIQNAVKNGKTVTLRAALCHAPGADTAAQAVYFTGTAGVQAATISTGDLTGQLSGADGTELTSATASTGVQMIVSYDES